MERENQIHSEEKNEILRWKEWVKETLTDE